MEIDNLIGEGLVSWIKHATQSTSRVSSWKSLLDGKVIIELLAKLDEDIFVSSRLIDLNYVTSENEMSMYKQSNLDDIYNSLGK